MINTSQGVTLSFAPSFQACWVKAVIPLSLTLGVNNTGKAGNDAAEFCHLCRRGCFSRTSTDCFLDLDLPPRS